MILRIVGIDRQGIEPEVHYYVFVEASRITEDGKTQTAEFCVTMERKDLSNYRPFIESYARDIFLTESPMQSLVGDTWSVSDPITKKDTLAA